MLVGLAGDHDRESSATSWSRAGRAEREGLGHVAMIVAYAHEWAMVSAGSDSTFHQVFIVGPIYLFLTCWQFVGLATLADNYLCPTLENFCKQLKLSTGLAGATFLAFGSSAPELAIACASALSNKTELSIPTVLTSALIAFGLIPPVVVFSTVAVAFCSLQGLQPAANTNAQQLLSISV